MMTAHQRALLPLYLPSLLLGIPAQASFVLLPLYVLDQGGSVAAAAAVIGWRGVGMMVMDIPAGMLAARWGDKAVMLLASVGLVVAFLGYATSTTITSFYIFALINGASSSTFLLGRMAYISDTLAGSERGRVIAMIAGSLRLAALLGPLAGGALAPVVGFSTALAIGAAMMALGAATIAMTARPGPRSESALKWHAIPHLAITHRRIFATAGVGAIAFMLMRSARTVLIPLLGASIGLDAAAVGLVVSMSALVDVALFYPAGVIMDRHGRRATAVPSSMLFALALVAMSFVDTYTTLVIAAIAAGIANGLSTGIVMTLGTDLAPPAERGEFLGLWRLLTDVGTAAGPMVVSTVVVMAPLSVAALCAAACGGVGSLIIYRWVEETLPQDKSGDLPEDGT